jgi:hypothetical protein
MRAGGGLRRCWARRPALHFALIGAVLLASYRAWSLWAGPGDAAGREAIVISAENRRDIEAEFQARWGTAPSAAQARALLNHAVEEELLYRAARALAMDFQDASVRRRLFEKARAVNLRPTGGTDMAQEAVALGLDDDIVIRRLLAEKMRLLLQEDASGDVVSDAEIAAHLERNRERFLQPETVTFTQVFLSSDRRGREVAAAAAAARAELGGGPPSDRSARLSDPFPLGGRLSYTAVQLSGRFGKPFADQVLALPPRLWSQPIASPYGLHLVWVDEHRAAQLPSLDDVRAPIRVAIIKERAARNLQRGLAQLRALYDVRIEDIVDASPPS